MARCTRVAKLRRVDIVYRLLLLGLDSTQIAEHVGRKYPSWGVTESAVRKYVAEAKELLIKAGDYERHMERGRAMARLHDLYTRCLQAKRYRDALAVQTEINKLAGLNEPQRVEITEVLVAVEDAIEQKRREVAELERQYGLPAVSATTGP